MTRSLPAAALAVAAATAARAGITYSGNDGSSADKAIVIEGATGETDCVDAGYRCWPGNGRGRKR